LRRFREIIAKQYHLTAISEMYSSYDCQSIITAEGTPQEEIEAAEKASRLLQKIIWVNFYWRI
jgi:hypothetical protein